MKKKAEGKGTGAVEYSGRLADVEAALERMERKLASIEIEANSGKRRLNAVVDFYEHRIDQIYRQVVNELGRALGTGGVVADSEAEIDLQLTRIFGRALKDAPKEIAAHVASALTDEIRPGHIAAPLTLAGFRLDRNRCRETGIGVEIFSKRQSGPGIAIFGPYRRLKPGIYRLTSAIRVVNPMATLCARRTGEVVFDVYSARLDRVVGVTKTSARRLSLGIGLSVDFEWPTEAAEGPVEFRLHQRSISKLNVTAFELSALPDRV